MKTLTLVSLPDLKHYYLLALAVSALVVLEYLYLPAGADFTECYRPAALALMAGESPYVGTCFYNPPWILLLMMPLALLPAKLGSAFITTANLILYAILAYRMKASRLAFVAFISLPLVFYVSNIDPLAALGFLMPPQIGLFFVLLKPHTGLGVALFWLVLAYQRGRVREVVRVFAPIGLAFLASFVLFGLYPFKGQAVAAKDWNIINWPWLLPVGLVLIVSAVQRRDIRRAILASPFLMPYYNFYCTPVTILGLLPNSWQFIAAIIGLWIVDLTRNHFVQFLLGFR